MEKNITKSKPAVQKKEQPTRLETVVREVSGKRQIHMKNLDETTKNLLAKSTGCSEPLAGWAIIERLLYANTDGGESIQTTEARGNHVLAALAELKPQDAFEGMLLSQMISVFGQAMECFRLAILNKGNYFEASLKYQNQGIKLMRVYNQQLEALDKHRRGGQQRMVVVHEGGQAIVGDIHQTGDKK